LPIRSRLWSDFSFIASSGYREKVITALAASPKLPHQLAKETNLRLTHVSRSLREMAKRGLVECLTPTARSHGRLYALTEIGSRLVAYRQSSRRRFSPPSGDSRSVDFVPKIRASLALAAIRHMDATLGRAKVRDILRNWSVDPDDLTKDTWLSIDAADEYLELLESQLGNGNGNYDFVRTITSKITPAVGSIREQLMKAMPLSALVERAPIVWSKEWNYGRLVVEKGHRHARFQHFDWLPTPAFCAGAQGAYEGVLRARGVEGTVTKTKCVRSGDECCEYLVKW